MDRYERKRKRRQRLALLYPDRRPEDVEAEIGKKTGRILLIAGGTFALILAIVVMSGGRGGDIVRSLTRPEPEEPASVTTLDVDAEGETLSISVQVDSRTYYESEKEEILASAEAQLRKAFLGENPSEDRVYSDLVFDCTCEIEGVTFEWTPLDLSLVGWDGHIAEGDYRDGVRTSILLEMCFQEAERDCLIGITLVEMPEDALTLEEKLKAALTAANASGGDTMELPGAIGDTQIQFRIPRTGSGAGIVLFLGMLTLLAILYLPEQRMREAEKQRNQELELSYSEMTSKLSVLLGAGLSLRGAWEKMVGDYERSRAGGGPRRILYEEMSLTKRSLTQGTGEDLAYTQFGERTGLTCYLRLGNLLESNRKNGRSELCRLLASESEEACRNRLELARRRGEEISSRLLLPLMILFALVLTMIIVPALMTW